MSFEHSRIEETHSHCNEYRPGHCARVLRILLQPHHHMVIALGKLVNHFYGNKLQQKTSKRTANRLPIMLNITMAKAEITVL